MRIDPEHCRDPDLLAAEARRLQAVIAASEPAITDAEPPAASAGSLSWIPVDERLPDEGVLVLAYNGRCDYGFRRDGQWIDTLYGGVLGNSPTHWMPLPEPPTDAK